MTVITHARRKSRLARMIDSAGGITIGVALTRARKNISALRERGLEEIARHIDELVAIKAPEGPEETIRTLQQIYRAANHVIDAAAPFDLRNICAVAISLCDMVDRASAEGAVFDWRIMAVHIQSLRLLNALPLDATEQRAEVAAQLAEMVARKFGPTG
jgi:chemotaxis protein histidine kinase CheA